MANITITALPAAGALAGTEPIPLDQAGVTKKATAQAIADLAGAAIDAAIGALTPGDIGAATTAVVTTLTAGLQPATSYGTIAYAAQVTLDFAARNGQMNTITLTGALELLASNLANGREVRLRLIAGASGRTLTFPAGWKFWTDKPATLPANKEMVLSLGAFGSASTDVRAIALVEP